MGCLREGHPKCLKIPHFTSYFLKKGLHSFCQEFCKEEDNTIRSYLTIFFINDIRDWIKKVLNLQNALSSKALVKEKKKHISNLIVEGYDLVMTVLKDQYNMFV